MACFSVSAPAVAQQSAVERTSSEIVFLCNREGIDSICAIDSSTTEIRQITKAGDPKGPPRWSPNRRSIAFHQRSGDRTDVFTMNVDGTNVRKITDSDGVTLYRNPAWSPDGRQLAIECGKPPVWDVCVVAINGTAAARKLTHGAEGGYSSEGPDWSPDGKRIAFQSNRDAAPISGPRGPVRGYDVYVTAVDGDEVRRLSTTPAGRSTVNPAWSPDGSKLVVASTRDGDVTDWGLYLLSPESGSIQAITHDRTAYGYGHPRWSRDGRFFVFHSTREGAERSMAGVELYVIGADGTAMRRLTNNHEYDGFADW
jgi:TolB protein